MDAIRSTAGFDPTAAWPEAPTDEAAAEPEEDCALGRGIVFGLLLSCFLWAGLIFAIRTLVALFL